MPLDRPMRGNASLTVLLPLAEMCGSCRVRRTAGFVLRPKSRGKRLPARTGASASAKAPARPRRSSKSEGGHEFRGHRERALCVADGRCFRGFLAPGRGLGTAPGLRKFKCITVEAVLYRPDSGEPEVGVLLIHRVKDPPAATLPPARVARRGFSCWR